MKSNDFSPIAEQGELELEAGLFSKLRRRRELAPIAPGFARILLDAESAPIEELTAGQKYWSRARGWVKVDVRSHPLEYEIPFADPSGLAGFIATIDVSVAVSDPVGAVRDGAESTEAIVRPALQNAVRRAHAASGPPPEMDPVAVLNALRVTADRNLEALLGPLPEIADWLSAKVTSVSVELDEATKEHREQLLSKLRAVAIADADGQSDLAKAKNDIMVRRAWEDGFADHLADPEKRALARIAADPSRENIDRVVGQFDQIEEQGRAAIVEMLREAINNGYFAEDDAIHNAISALEKQYGNPQHALGRAEPAKEVGAPEVEEHLVEAETVEADAEEDGQGESEGKKKGEDRPDNSWSE